MAKPKYKNVSVTIHPAKSIDDFDNGCFQSSDGGKHKVKSAIQNLEQKSGGYISIHSATGLPLGSYNVSHKKIDNAWLLPTLEKKGIEIN